MRRTQFQLRDGAPTALQRSLTVSGMILISGFSRRTYVERVSRMAEFAAKANPKFSENLRNSIQVLPFSHGLTGIG